LHHVFVLERQVAGARKAAPNEDHSDEVPYGESGGSST